MSGLTLTVADLQDFYCEMAASMYAAGAKSRRYSKDPSKKGFRRVRGELMHIDTWTSMGDFSFGETKIVHRANPRKPLWLMTYIGWIADVPHVSAFLRDCLSWSYSRGLFLGGRGPELQLSGLLPGVGGLAYNNRLGNNSSFVGFSGCDFIDTLAIPARRLYQHWYGGSLLVPVVDGVLELE